MPYIPLWVQNLGMAEVEEVLRLEQLLWIYWKTILSMIGFQGFLGQYLILIPPTKPLNPSRLARIQGQGHFSGLFLPQWLVGEGYVWTDIMCEMSMRYWTNKLWKPIIKRIILQWTIGVVLTFKLLQWTMFVEQSLNSQIQIYFSSQMDMEDRMNASLVLLKSKRVQGLWVWIHE